MSNLNVAIVQGNLTDTPKIMGNEENRVARFTIASNIGTKNRPETAFIDCVAFGKQVAVIESHLIKGQQVNVRGQIVMNKWEDAEGNKRSKLEIRLENYGGFFFTGNKVSNGPAEVAVNSEPEDAETEGSKLF
jgi:single-strand DNA-binding protein